MTPLVDGNCKNYKRHVQNTLIPILFMLVFSGCSQAKIEPEKKIEKSLTGKKLVLYLFVQDQTKKFPSDTIQVKGLDFTFDHRFGFGGTWYEFDCECSLDTDKEIMTDAFISAWYRRQFQEFPSLTGWLSENVTKVVSEVSKEKPATSEKTTIDQFDVEIRCARTIQGVYDLSLRLKPTS